MPSTQSKDLGKTGATEKQDGPFLLKRNPQLEDSHKPKQPSSFSHTGQKRSSELAFDSPDQRLNNRAPVSASQLEQPLSKKPSFGHPASLMKSAVVKNAFHMPQVEGVRVSNEKLRFASRSSGSSTSSTSSLLSMAPTTYHQSLKNSAASSAKSSFSSLVSTATSTTTTNNFHAPSSQIAMSAKQYTPYAGATTPGPSKTELPEIFSESEDDGDGSVILDWANSPELRSMLIQQQQVDPDSVFGPIAPLKMEEVFKTARMSKFRARSSSANWNGPDKLSQQEVESYARDMGYK